MEQYSIPDNRQVQILASALLSPALDYFFDHIHTKVDEISDAWQLMDSRFNSPRSQAQAQSYLESLTLASIRTAENCSTHRALEIAQQKIDAISHQCGPAYTDESHKGRWLSNMLRFEVWAQNSCTARLTHAQDYPTFISALHAALTQQTIAQTQAMVPNDQSRMALNFFGRQYATPPNVFRRRPPRAGRPRQTREQLRQLKRRTRCLKCGELGHWKAECHRRDLSITNAISARLNRNGSSIQETLYAIAQDDDKYSEYLADIKSCSDEETTSATDGTEETRIAEAWMARLQPEPFDALFSALNPEGFLTTPSSDPDIKYTLDLTPQDAPLVGSSREQNPFDIYIITYDAPVSIHSLQRITSVYNAISAPFLGGLVDTGAQRTVIGIVQAKSYFRAHNAKPVYHKTSRRYRFGRTVMTSNRFIDLVISTPGKPIHARVDVVECDIPLLLGLDLLDEYSLQPLTVFNKLECVTDYWRAPLTRHNGHIYYRWLNLAPIETRLYYTNAELERMHLHFSHPNARKLYEMLLRSSDKPPPPNTLPQIEAIVAACTTCREFSPRAVTFRVRAADQVPFNQRLLLDLVWLPTNNPSRSTRPALHIVDAGTRFNAAAFLNGESAVDVWNHFIRSWTSMYIGMPSSVLVDQGSVFVSDEWQFACELNGIEVTSTGSQSHNSLGAGESYHAYLRRTYNKIRKDFPLLDDDVTLAIAIKAINDCTGPKGLCPTLLVFGTLPQFPKPSLREHKAQRDRFRAAAAARAEYEKIVTQERIQLATKTRPPPTTKATYMPGDLVYAYRERLKKYTGPHMIASVHGKCVNLHVGEKEGPRPFNIAQIRPSPLPNAFSENLHEPAYPPQILHTEVLSRGDPREALFTEEKKRELQGLLEKGAFRICLKEEAGQNPNILPTRYVLAIKHSEGDAPAKLKARFVLGGHRDRDRHTLVHDAHTIRPESTRLIVALATIFGFKLALADWRQGYIQSKSDLLRRVFIRPTELELKPDELVQVLRPVYGLPDAGEYWHDTLAHHLASHCQFQQAHTDLALWLKCVAGKLVALAGTYVDDVLLAGEQEALDTFQKISRNRFDVSIDTSDILGYLGLRIITRPDGTRSISQPKQIERLDLLPLTTDFKRFRSARATMAWLQQTRPDIACAISMAARITNETFTPDAIRAYNTLVRYLRRTKSAAMQFPKLDSSTLRIAQYVDAGHCNTTEGYSQIGYVTCLADSSNTCAIIGFSSRKSRRVVRSTTAGEAISFADGFDAAYSLRSDIELALGRKLPIVLLTDSEILFNVITRRRTTSERRLMVDLRIVRESYANREISNIALIASEDNIADSMTKIRSNDALCKTMATSRLNHKILQYVIEPPSATAG